MQTVQEQRCSKEVGKQGNGKLLPVKGKIVENNGELAFLHTLNDVCKYIKATLLN